MSDRMSREEREKTRQLQEKWCEAASNSIGNKVWGKKIIREDVPRLLDDVEALEEENMCLCEMIVSERAAHKELDEAIASENARLRERAKNNQDCYVSEMCEHQRTKMALDAAKRDLALIPTICFGDCSGDLGVGVPDCPFYDYAEPDDGGYPRKRECRYATEAMRGPCAENAETNHPGEANGMVSQMGAPDNDGGEKEADHE